LTTFPEHGKDNQLNFLRMKRLNLRSRKLFQLGFNDDELISRIIEIVHANFRNRDRDNVIDLLKDMQIQPSAYLAHPIFSSIASQLTAAPKARPVGEITLAKAVLPFEIFGEEQIEQEALIQMETAMRLPVTVKGALMADAHSGYGLPIGGVLATRHAVIPFGVGMDIGCRMCLTVFDLPPAFIRNNTKRLKEILIENTRFGHDEFPGKKDHPVLDRREFVEIPFLRNLKDKASHQLGTSGHGNHFADIGRVRILKKDPLLNLSAGEYTGILTHSGSRNLGANIAHHYTHLAKMKCRLPKGAINLAWLDLSSEEGQEYWLAMNLAGDYSAANHQVIHQKLAAALAEQPVSTVENHHNFAWQEALEDGQEVIVHRKGATPASTGSLGVIPGSMTMPGFIVKGKGNQASIRSASHGAGRQLSRSQAKSKFSEKILHEALYKAGVELIGGGLDEAPGAYKDIHKIMDYQKDLVEIIGTFEPQIVRMSND
jgi:tRNA-splicing ligase RtcB